MQTEPWNISPEMRQQVIDTLMRIIEDGEPEDQIEACRVLIEADAQNQQAERDRAWLPKPHQN